MSNKAANIMSAIGELSRGTVIESAPMKAFTSIGAGGPADVLWSPADENELLKGLDMGEREGWEFHLLGGGTNVLVRDGGLPGLTILMRGTMDAVDIADGCITAGAGASLPRLASMAARAGLSGLEFAARIPGTLGGAVKTNAGAFGVSISDILLEATVRLPANNNGAVANRLTKWRAGDFSFGYRSSGLPDGALVIEIKLKLNESEEGRVRERMTELREKRRASQPTGAQSAGCVFKNPPGDSAARLIDAAGLKGRRRGGAMVSPVHAGFIVNTGGATATDVLALMDDVHKAVFDATGIDLLTEIQIIGRDAP